MAAQFIFPFPFFPIPIDDCLSKSPSPDAQVAYFGIFAFSVLFAGIVSLFVGLIPELACAMAAMKMHQKMLYGIIRAPMSFFDTTPTGRVLARFSGDIEDVESDLAPDLLGIVDCIFEVISYWLRDRSAISVRILCLSFARRHRIRSIWQLQNIVCFNFCELHSIFYAAAAYPLKPIVRAPSRILAG